jgi:hypothetical protein
MDKQNPFQVRSYCDGQVLVIDAQEPPSIEREYRYWKFKEWLPAYQGVLVYWQGKYIIQQSEKPLDKPIMAVDRIYVRYMHEYLPTVMPEDLALQVLTTFRNYITKQIGNQKRIQ